MYGVDVAGYQTGFNMIQARQEGESFAIVKAAGFNTGTLYVANGYEKHVDNAKAAGLGVGHYYVPGRGNPTIQADWLVDHLHRFDYLRDVIALDNEPLDSNAVYWKQDQVMEFFNRIRTRMSIPFEHMWLYCPASLTRANGPWTAVTNAKVKIWWSAYGKNSGVRDHEPSLQGMIARWDIHQYTSRKLVAGMRVDGNYTPHSMAALFGTTAAVKKPSTGGSFLQSMSKNTSWKFNLPNRNTARRIQKALKYRGRYNGPVDGVFGPNTIRGIQLSIHNVGYRGKIDGIPGPQTCYYIQKYAQQFGDYRGPVDRVLGDYTWAGFALGLERP